MTAAALTTVTLDSPDAATATSKLSGSADSRAVQPLRERMSIGIHQQGVPAACRHRTAGRFFQAARSTLIIGGSAATIRLLKGVRVDTIDISQYGRVMK
mgnify:CR=1 FL=1